MAAPPNPQQERDEHTVKLLKYLFHEKFVPEEKIAPANAGFVMPLYFFGWLDKHMALMNGEEICAALEISYDIWVFVREVVESGTAIERMHQVWYNVSLGNRPQAKHKLEKMNLVMLLTWADGTILPVQVFVSQEMLSDGLSFTDGHIASLIAKNSQQFTQAVIQDGLDGLHDRGKNYRGATQEDPFEVCMGLLISPIKYNTLREDLKPCVEMYARLLQGIVRPVLPPEIKAAIEAQKRQAGNPGKALGGWDAG